MHEWGDSAALFGLRSASTESEDGGAVVVETVFERLADGAKLLPQLIAKRRKIIGPPKPTGPSKLTAAKRRPPTVPADPDALARAVVSGGMAEARRYMEARRRSGASAQSLMLEDIALAARRLGDFWRDDDFDFFAVTQAARALGMLLRDVLPDEPVGLSPRAPSAIFTLAPGETHELGADIVAGLFRMAGWRAERCEIGELSAALAREPFDVVGFSLSSERFAEALPGAIAKARAAARRRELTILLGGAVFAAKPELAKALGADVAVPKGDIGAWPHRLRKALRS